MLPRFSLFRKPDRLTTSFGSQKWHCSLNGNTGLRINSSFATCAGIFTVFSLSTLYALNGSKSKVTASPIVNDEKHPKNRSKYGEWRFDWDHRTVPSPNRSKRSFTLIRHGQYVHALNPDDKVLTDLGKQQAKITGQKLKSLGIEYDQIICSEMVRAKQTADIITNEIYDDKTKQNIDIKYDSNLNEGAPSISLPERDDLNKSGFYDNLDEDSVRISKAFETYIHRNDNDKDMEILIIGHGNVFRYFMCRVLQFPVEGWLRFNICNCGITKFRVYADGKVAVDCIGSGGHFEKNEVSFN